MIITQFDEGAKLEIPGYHEGANITILDTQYIRPIKDESTGKTLDDILILTYEDLDKGEKKSIEFVKPSYEYYMLKDYLNPKTRELAKEKYTYSLMFAPIEHCEKITIPYKDRLLTMAYMTGNEKAFFNNISSGNAKANNDLYKSPFILNADMDIEDNIRIRFSRLFKNEPKSKIKKGYFDIETDNINDINDFPAPGEFPVNALTYINQDSKHIKVFLLRTSERPNPQIKEFEDWVKNNPKEALNELKEFVIKSVGGIDRAKRYKLDEFAFEYLFFDEEIDLLGTFFDSIHKEEPDFLLVWNMGFDIPYLYERLLKLGYDAENIMCDPSYKYKKVDIFVDNEHSEFNKKSSYFKITGKTVYIDQLIHFASRRSGTKFPNYKLDYIGQTIAKVRKLDYSHLTTHIPELPYVDYKTFVYYNVMDTIVQMCIECETNDVNYLYTKCNYNFTRYDKCHRQTVYLTNRATQEFYKDGLIIGNNVAKFSTKEGKYPGVA